MTSPVVVVTPHTTPHTPGQCSKTACPNTPTNQYQASDGQGNTLAVFACNTHSYTDTPQATGLHQPTCTLFPCNCTPTQPTPTPITPSPNPSHTK